ncbi:MAG: hypothetical protein COY58_01120 [Gammaproteobacteria bacterium CG_4_10_14_0_8_um_filter_38_16]|nr:MAG: hypothetical protein COY58_01120 [Gammaproteobacteria bacterium CG_4_10_14_0_8_um_filter_38_16]PJA03246.1 MAG: hypothetical protein COX72_06120 [Gammaproteobacteria bacterium CG_4_10_14_0_2_um_filter_38_22]PJB10882.1 MAG: hypothetical protein CO120_02385 [Gammaproteobacteria bacterium CG_4_9_14_3_um_filter_38_9]
MYFKKTIFFIFGVFFSISIFAKNPVLNIQHWVLENKAHVFFVRRTEVPMLDMAVIFSAGSSLDGKTKGIAALTNAMMGEGAAHFSAEQIAKNFESVGAQFNTFVNRDMAGLQLRSLVDVQFLNSALKNFKTVVSSPTFPKKEISRIKQQTLAQLALQNENPSDIASNAFFHLLYPHNPYGHNPLGNSASLRMMKQKELMQFFEKYYVGANADIILVGDITTAQAKNIAENVGGKLPSGKVAPILVKANNLTAGITKYIPYSATQNTIMLGQVGITRENPDYFPLILGNVILGGSQTSLLYKAVREKNGLAYFASSGFDPLKYRGPFIMALQSKNTSAKRALLLTKNVFDRFLNEGPTKNQLLIAQQNLIGGLSLAIASNRGILRVLINIAFYHRPLDFLNTFAQHVSVVTPLDVKRAFRKNLSADKLVTVVVGKKVLS